LASAYAKARLGIRTSKAWLNSQPLLEAFQLVPCCPFAIPHQQGLASPYASARVGRRSQPTHKQGLG